MLHLSEESRPLMLYDDYSDEIAEDKGIAWRRWQESLHPNDPAVEIYDDENDEEDEEDED